MRFRGSDLLFPCADVHVLFPRQIATLKDQLAQEMRKRQMYISRSVRTGDEIKVRVWGPCVRVQHYAGHSGSAEQSPLEHLPSDVVMFV